MQNLEIIALFSLMVSSATVLPISILIYLTWMNTKGLWDSPYRLTGVLLTATFLIGFGVCIYTASFAMFILSNVLDTFSLNKLSIEASLLLQMSVSIMTMLFLYNHRRR